MLNIIGRFFRRVVVYQVIFFWAILKLKNLQKYSNELKDIITTNMNSINLKIDFIDFILQYPEPLTKYSTYLEIIFATLALFGLRFGAYMSAGLCTCSALIYFNPLLPENKISFFNLKIDLLFVIGVIIVILIDCCFDIKKKPKSEEEYEDLDVQEEKTEKIKKKKKLE